MAIRLNDSAMKVIVQRKDYSEAISLLNQATQIDSDYYLGFANKLYFQLEEKQFDSALKTAKNLSRIKPGAPDYYVIIGVLNDLTGDSVSANKFYSEASTRYNAILDTMSSSNKEFDILSMNKAINLVLIGQQQRGNEILIKLYKKQNDSNYKELIASFMNKSKKKIMELYTNNKLVQYAH